MELGDMSLYELLQKGTVPPEGPKFAQEIAVGVFGPELILRVLWWNLTRKVRGLA